MRRTGRTLAVAVAAAIGAAGALGASALLLRDQRDQVWSIAAVRPVWTEVQWPFPVDPWGKGKAFRCKAGDCGSEVNLYVRAKLGFCNCTTGIADDTDLDLEPRLRHQARSFASHATERQSLHTMSRRPPRRR